MFFQDIIKNLNNFWSEEGCLIMQPYDTEKGAGTMNPHTFLRAIGPEPWSVAYAEPCRRPTDGRFGDSGYDAASLYLHQLCEAYQFKADEAVFEQRFKRFVVANNSRKALLNRLSDLL